MDLDPDALEQFANMFSLGDLGGYDKDKPLKLADHKDKLDKLPFEDVTWYIKLDNEFTQTADENGGPGPPISLMAVMDGSGKFIRTSIKPMYGAASEEEVYVRMESVLVEAMLCPMWGVPRKPRLLDGDRNLQIEQLKPEDWGMHLCVRASGHPPPSYYIAAHAWQENMRACMTCHKRGTKNMFSVCPGCQGVYYCTPLCQIQNASPENGPHSHTLWCNKIRDYMTQASALAQLPFDFMPETSSPEFDDKKYRAFLAKYDVFIKGIWLREVSLGSHHDPLPGFGEIDLPADESPYTLAEENTILQSPSVPSPPNLDKALSSWEEYYIWRSLPKNSPICILLQYPLTLYYILTTCFPKDFPNRPQLNSDTETVTIHVLGVEKEADILPVFYELGALLPHFKLNIYMLGPGLSKRVHGKVVKHNNVQIQLRRKYYHKSELATKKPMLAIGFNAGIGAYPSWAETIRTLKCHDTPSYFTDYCHYSADFTGMLIQTEQLGSLSRVDINPFRSPVRKYCEEHLMPWYSNAFLFHINYLSDVPLD